MPYDPWTYLWNKLNTKLANDCADGKMTEEDMESITDEAMLAGMASLRRICANHGIVVPRRNR